MNVWWMVSLSEMDMNGFFSSSEMENHGFVCTWGVPNALHPAHFDRRHRWRPAAFQLHWNQGFWETPWALCWIPGRNKFGSTAFELLNSEYLEVFREKHWRTITKDSSDQLWLCILGVDNSVHDFHEGFDMIWICFQMRLSRWRSETRRIRPVFSFNLLHILQAVEVVSCYSSLTKVRGTQHFLRTRELRCIWFT